ncbi:unnamed protein product [Notodromas monacha]|uniref:Protein GUCD1 n=1 Tax=Notodromas monacha TaxID=399045 RepID=A0A7R9BNQ2_9CRUS|nr:unnamed protein product [Notodromas monacha]CAG0918852.1 unnamed protein product [Notodromas monacha]
MGTRSDPTESLLPETRLVEVTHVRQRFTWDCGIACVSMMLYPEQRKDLLGNLLKIAEEEGFQKSTWTIDLAYLLKRFNIPCQFRTLTKGVDPSFSSKSFYQTFMNKDHPRVLRKFEEAEQHGIDVQLESVPMDTILRHLNKHGPVIVLTNARLLYCKNCGHNAPMRMLRNIFPTDGKGFDGHYITVVGYSLRNRRIYYRNPALKDAMENQFATMYNLHVIPV